MFWQEKAVKLLQQKKAFFEYCVNRISFWGAEKII